jgi:hypothetical protein
MSENNGSGNGQPGADGAGNGTGGEGGTPWTAVITDPDVKGFAELKGWKGPEDAVKSYRDLEKFQGVPAERLLKLPETGDADGWKAINAKLGFAPPTEAKDYNLPVPDGFERGFADAMSAKFHEIGVPTEMGRKIAEAANAFNIEQMKLAEQQLDLEHKQDGEKLKAEWGGNYDKLTQLADRASDEIVKKGWISPQEMELMRDALGSAKWMKLMANLGSQQGEAAFHTNDQSQGGSYAMTPDAARVRLNQLAKDGEWMKRLEAGGVKEKQEYAQLRETLALAAAGAR